MSHLRRHAGRFGTHTSAEAYQRQITAPVRKWRKVWVAPTGLQPESSYKVCKWVKLDKTEEDADEAFTPAADGDEDEEAELLDGDEGEGEGDADDDLDKEAETPALATPTAGTPGVETSALPTPDSEMPPPPLPSSIPAQPSALSEPPITAESVEETGSAPEPSQAEVVHNNAVEITNTAPGHTEEGLGEAGQAGSIIEMKVPEVENGPAEPAAPLATVDMAAAVDGDVTMEGAEPEAAKSEEALVQDEGLVMGEMEPPQPELAVQGGDHEPLESEAK